jgi:hypothetical protein
MIPAPAWAGITLQFRQGLDGYSGTADTQLDRDFASMNFGNSSRLIVDGNDVSGNGRNDTLIRFDDVFGAGPGQITPGSVILSATLTLVNSGDSSDGSGAAIHRMLIGWDEASATFDSFGGGVSADGVQASTTADDSLPGGIQPGPYSFDVTSSLQAWASGQTNFGWAILSLGSNGFHSYSSEEGSLGVRPTLTVQVAAVPEPSTLMLGSIGLILTTIVVRRR